MRLDKLLVHTGFGSRKEVKELIRKKRVQVNGKIITQANKKIDVKKDRVEVDQKEVNYQKYVYLMLNKPDGYISATEDSLHMTVLDLIDDSFKHLNIFPVGRLDKDTEGLLILTNDGELNHKLTSPNYSVPKTYYAVIDDLVNETDVAQFNKGVILDDGYKTRPGKLEIISAKTNQSEVLLTITEGKFHQVKRMFEAVGKKVIYLKRMQLGSLKLDEGLEKGTYRSLTTVELEELVKTTNK